MSSITYFGLHAKRHWFWIGVALVATAALVTRLYAIDRLPPGLFGDEAVEGLDALDVLAGNPTLWFHAHLGREPLFVYLVALSYRLFDVTPLATRLPAVLAGLLTVPAAFFFVKEWAADWSRQKAMGLALLVAALVTISFWHLQMTRDAHRDILLPLVEAVGYGLFWRSTRTGSLRTFAACGAVLGLAIYTYSPGRFVGLFMAAFLLIELLVRRWTRPNGTVADAKNWHWRGLGIAAVAALVIMAPLGLYFLQNPAQFTRRFASVSIFDSASPFLAGTASVIGNLAQFVVPDAGYQSLHYNLPGKPVFDIWTAPWFLAGLVIAIVGLRRAQYRFLVLWFVVMLVPAFLTADMIPKGVRALGVVPCVFVFPALAMVALVERAAGVWRASAISLVALSLLISLGTSISDYYSWSALPRLPLAFDIDMVQVSEYLQRQSTSQPIFVSTEVYRHPTLMLLGKRVPTSKYFDRAVQYR